MVPWNQQVARGLVGPTEQGEPGWDRKNPVRIRAAQST